MKQKLYLANNGKNIISHPLGESKKNFAIPKNINHMLKSIHLTSLTRGEDRCSKDNSLKESFFKVQIIVVSIPKIFLF